LGSPKTLETLYKVRDLIETLVEDVLTAPPEDPESGNPQKTLNPKDLSVLASTLIQIRRVEVEEQERLEGGKPTNVAPFYKMPSKA